MKTLTINILLGFGVYLLMSACESKPKVIEGEPIESSESISSFKNPTDKPVIRGVSSDEHKVKVEEVLNTDRYSYLNVTEEGEKFWIAIPKKEIEIGGTYYYKGGLLKRNFESKEYNRVFETLYLVSDVTPNSITSYMSSANEASEQGINTLESINIKLPEGSIKLAELFSNPDKYQGKVVQITGTCVKVNPMIMDRNWIHIQDGSGDGLDLTVTTTENVPIDAVVSFEGVISLNKDFGAGYRYDIIMENAILK